MTTHSTPPMIGARTIPFSQTLTNRGYIHEALYAPAYADWIATLIDATEWTLARPGTTGEFAPTLAFDGPGSKMLARLLARTREQNRRTVVFTIHSHPIWHAALAYTGATPVPWPDGPTGVARELDSARSGLTSPRWRIATAGMTPSEARVLGHLLTGRTGAQVAEILGSSVKTVNTHVANVLAKRAPGQRTNRAELLLEIANSYYDGSPDPPTGAA